MAERDHALLLSMYRLALLPGVTPYVLTPDSTSFDSRGP